MPRKRRLPRQYALGFGLCVLCLCACTAPKPKPEERQRTEVRRSGSAAQPNSEQAQGEANQSGVPGTGTQGYLPPSEKGARMEVSEVPLAGTTSAPAQPATPANAQRGGPSAAADGAKRGGDAGGEVPRNAPALYHPPAGTTAPAAPVNAKMTTTDTPKVEGAKMPQALGVGTAEQAAVTQRKLQTKIAEFERLMRRAQAEADAERRRGGSGGRLAAPANGSGAGGGADIATGGGNTPDLSGDTRPDTRHALVTAPPPSDLPSGNDDDVVARQLREAASVDPDPILREKLWNEYRKYKRGLRTP